MESWNIIVNTAILGTDKKNIEAKNLPTNLQLPVETILLNSTIDKEEKFLQVSALVYNYRQAGSLPINKQILDAFTCKEENQPYVSDAATKVLTEILAEENIPLLTFWLGLCQQKNQIVQPVFIPQLFDIGINQKKLQTIISICCGNRGEWLSQLNTSWAFIQQQLPEQLWQTGTFEQRKTVLQTIRADKPELAIEWLQQTWPQEDANTKTNLLQLLQINISEKDIDFLNGLSKEKSKKVKDEAIKLLKKIPS
jgi:hypothetical protein